MKHVHAREYLKAGDIVVVECSHQCNIRVMNDTNYHQYKNGGGHEYHGGFFERFPARISVPSSGHWNVALDLGGGSANIKSKIGYIKH
jgi:hypothetical protein